MKYVILILLVYFLYRFLKSYLPKITLKESKSRRSQEKSSINIPEEDIRDADFQEIDDD
ncbi:MAG: hypothetical protein H8E82_04810 [Candidatus Marinimicrobia bacterium]|nr:hypothetical protein [Candidatus Neomarinimicrobiota bacterium]